MMTMVNLIETYICIWWDIFEEGDTEVCEAPWKLKVFCYGNNSTGSL